MLEFKDVTPTERDTEIGEAIDACLELAVGETQVAIHHRSLLGICEGRPLQKIADE